MHALRGFPAADRVQDQMNIGMQLSEPPKKLGQDLVRQRTGRGNGDRRFLPLMKAEQRPPQLLVFLQAAHGILDNILPLRRELNPLYIPVNDHSVQFVLDLLKPLGQCRLRHKKSLCGLREVFAVIERDEKLIVP